MIFRAFKLYRDTKQGTADPTGFAAEQVKETVLGIVLIPVIIFVAILILLGLLGFTNIIVHASGVARAFFWIFFVMGIVFGIPAFVVGRLFSKLLKKGEDAARPQVTRIKTKVEDVIHTTFDNKQ